MLSMQTPTTSCKTILFIDDEEYILQIVQTCVEVFSEWKPITAVTANEGLAAVATNHPDVIVLDMMMPNVDGFTFIKQLKSDSQFANIPIILLTARADLIEPHRLSELGVQGAIAKPFYALSLVGEIKKILKWE
jgi:CheY-like chemotaxis protein